MNILRRFYRSLYLNTLFFLLLGVVIAAFMVAYMLPQILLMVQVALLILLLFVLLDIFLIYGKKEGVLADRICPDKLSNGDPNPIGIDLLNSYSFSVKVQLIDEVPDQFQWREKTFDLRLAPGEKHSLTYELRPVSRGEYHFHTLNVYAHGPLGLVRRRFEYAQNQMLACYPSFIQMRKYQLMAISNRLTEVGVKKIRRLGHTTEFEQIKEYVRGDDYRTINWKATARTDKLMVNQYIDERAQNVFCLVDESRVMKMPFEGMSLLDYAINASLVLSNISIYKHDKAGLITFAEKVFNFLPADGRPIQMQRIMETLYNQDTAFLEADYARLYATVKRRISHRSLLLLFTNFETVEALHRQLPYLQGLAKLHLLVVVFFENTELRELLHSRPATMEEIYIKTIGEDFSFVKRQIVKELETHGIISILTTPEELTINTLNKYLELKAKGMV